MVWRGVLLLCWHRLGCGSEDRALALYIRDAWLGTTNWGTSTNRRPIEPTDGTGRRPQRHRQIRSTLSDTCHGPPTRPFSPRPKASPTGRPYLARVGSGLRRFSVPLLLTGRNVIADDVVVASTAQAHTASFSLLISAATSLWPTPYLRCNSRCAGAVTVQRRRVPGVGLTRSRESESGCYCGRVTRWRQWPRPRPRPSVRSPVHRVHDLLIPRLYLQQEILPCLTPDDTHRALSRFRPASQALGPRVFPTRRAFRRSPAAGRLP
jgi:hypothetical protein